MSFLFPILALLTVLANLLILTWWLWRISFLQSKSAGLCMRAVVWELPSTVLSTGYLKQPGSLLLVLRCGMTEIKLGVKDGRKRSEGFNYSDCKLRRLTRIGTLKSIPTAR